MNEAQVGKDQADPLYTEKELEVGHGGFMSAMTALALAV